MTVTINVESIEVQALEGEYKKRGLGEPTTGYVLTPLDSLHKKLTEAVREKPRAEGDPHVHTFGASK
jgi:hypothetical protein